MNSLTTKSFSLLSDHMAVYQFMLDAYSPDYRNGLPAPFWEYALVSSWMDKSYLHRCRMWKDRETIVGFCFHENPVTDVYFTLRPGYEALAPEMAAYAAEHMPRLEGRHQLVLMGKQAELIEAAKIDGAGELYICFKIVMPLCKPVLASIGFLFLVNKWNDWNTALLYITKPDLYSLQYLLQKILKEAEYLKQLAETGQLMGGEVFPSESFRYAMAMVAAGPVLCIFPFFQKYFSKGMTLGGVKG